MDNGLPFYIFTLIIFYYKEQAVIYLNNVILDQKTPEVPTTEAKGTYLTDIHTLFHVFLSFITYTVVVEASKFSSSRCQIMVQILPPELILFTDSFNTDIQSEKLLTHHSTRQINGCLILIL